jgi:hypothetical protein
VLNEGLFDGSDTVVLSDPGSCESRCCSLIEELGALPAIRMWVYHSVATKLPLRGNYSKILARTSSEGDFPGKFAKNLSLRLVERFKIFHQSINWI